MLKSRKLSRARRWTYGIVSAAPLWHAVSDLPNITVWTSTQGTFFVLGSVAGAYLLCCAVIGSEPDWWWGRQAVKRRHTGH